MSYPATLPTWYDTFVTPITLAAMQHTTRHKRMESDITELAKKVGFGAALPVASGFLKGSADGSSTWSPFDLANDATGILPLARGGTNASTASSARTNLAVNSTTEITALIASAVLATKNACWPIGSEYVNYTDPTNPSILLGFTSTWVAVPGTGSIGIDPTQTEFNTPGFIGGAKTVTLALSQIPNSSGAISLHGGENGSFMAGLSGVFTATSGWTAQYKAPPGSTAGSQSAINGATFNSGGGGQAHNNLGPYVVVYKWKRTA